MYVWATPSKALLNYATNPRISFIVLPCLVNLLQLMEGKSASLCEFRKHPPTDIAQSQSLVDVTTLMHSKIYHPQLSQKMQNLLW